MVEESVSAGFAGHIHKRYGDGPTGPPVHDGQQISVVVGWWKRSYEVDMDRVELLNGKKGRWSRLFVTVDLGLLTAETGSGLRADRVFDAWPDETGGNLTYGFPNRWVSQVMTAIEKGLT